MNNSNPAATTAKSPLMQFIPVMLCFFSMGFVDLVGTATNFVRNDLNLSVSEASLFPSLLLSNQDLRSAFRMCRRA